ncbi:MAG TPA: NAD+ synthase [Bacteroidia bacterium]|nr:NAD+ synthase [Bacteroidia bacterium]
MKIALIQLNYHVGNIEGNAAKIKNGIKEAKAKGAELAVFAELAISGYPPKDLLLQNGFVGKCEKAAVAIAKECKGIAAIVGGPSVNTAKKGNPVYNSAYFMADGKVKSITHKTLLPFYDVFDEYRYFEPSKENKLISYKGNKIAVTICEDIWNQIPTKEGRYNHHRFPLKEMKAGKADFIINISASPFSYTHWDDRVNIACAVAKYYKTPLFYLNNIGTNTDLTFDGNSFVVNKKGEVLYQLASFKEDLQVFEVKDKKKVFVIASKAKQSLVQNFSDRDRFVPRDDVWYCSNSGDDKRITESVYNALVLGIRDYFHKSNVKKAVIGLSGGIDSSLVLVLAIEALGKENVMSVVLPSKFSSAETMKDAMQMLKNTDSPYQTVSIEPGVTAINESLTDAFKGLKPDITEENIQARMRGLLIMAVSNKTGALMLNTSNKSELAVGYGTLYGDMGGALSVLGDLYKTQVYRIAEYVNELTPGLIPENILKKAPTAELRNNQKDSDSLPEYDILDQILFQYIEMHKSVSEIKVNRTSRKASVVAQSANKELVEKVVDLVNNSEFKRHQFAPILRISPKAFGVGRRMPIVAKF